MNILKMKIHAYEEESQSLIVSFASDETASDNPDNYRRYAFQPINMWPDAHTVNELKKQIAVAGMWHAKQEADKEKFIADGSKIEMFKNLVGTEATYNVSDLLPPAAPQSDIPFDVSTPVVVI